MKNIWNWIKNNPNRTMFLVPILLVAGISISHVVTWYDMANPINWAIYLSIAIEVGAMTALVAATNKIKGGVWFMFGLVTFIQMIGNIFYSYVQIDPNGELFKNWVELTGPVWESMGTDLTDTIGLRRWLAFLEGGLLPLISLTSLHFFVKYEKKDEEEPNSVKNTQVESDKVWEKVKELKKEGKLTEPTEEDKENEPSVLANSQYRNEEDLKEISEELEDDVEIIYEEYDEEEDDEEDELIEEYREEKDVDLPESNENLGEIIEDVVKIEPKVTAQSTKNEQVVNNESPKKKMGIDRIR
jgi:hypothetical protein